VKPTPRTIDVGSVVAPFISSRDIIDKLTREIDRYDEVVLDFKNVSFLSRSAAHELMKYRNAHPEKRIRVVNTNETVSMILRVVRRPTSRVRFRGRHRFYRRRTSSKSYPVAVLRA